MKPPICAICKKRFDPSGKECGLSAKSCELSAKSCGLVYFSMRPSDVEWDKHMEETGKKGHPPYAAWFCSDHFKMAHECENLTIDKAMPRIRAYYGQTE
jgi:hypothetical protein